MQGLEQTGLERMRSIVDGRRSAPYGRLLGFGPAEVESGMVVFRGNPEEEHYNPQGIVHGGYAASILDSCMGCAIETMLDAGITYTTVELKVNYVRAVTVETGTITATGKTVHVGRKLATAEGRLVDANGRLLAHGSTTCMVLGAADRK